MRQQILAALLTTTFFFHLHANELATIRVIPYAMSVDITSGEVVPLLLLYNNGSRWTTDTLQVDPHQDLSMTIKQAAQTVTQRTRNQYTEQDLTKRVKLVNTLSDLALAIPYIDTQTLNANRKNSPELKWFTLNDVLATKPTLPIDNNLLATLQQKPLDETTFAQAAFQKAKICYVLSYRDGSNKINFLLYTTPNFPNYLTLPTIDGSNVITGSPSVLASIITSKNLQKTSWHFDGKKEEDIIFANFLLNDAAKTFFLNNLKAPGFKPHTIEGTVFQKWTNGKSSDKLMTTANILLSIAQDSALLELQTPEGQAIITSIVNDAPQPPTKTPGDLTSTLNDLASALTKLTQTLTLQR